MSFVDREAIDRVLRAISEALRPIGVQFEPQSAQITIDGTQVVAFSPLLLLESSLEKVNKDDDTLEELTDMLKGQHDAELEAEIERIRQSGGSLDAYEEIVDECLHTRRHPSGFCLDCHDGFNGLEPV